VESEVLSRIRSRQWAPGELIPKESDLAEEFGCARATVNRALRSVAESGLIDRRRKAGTRVTKNPVRKATLNIPIMREEIESSNRTYSYAVFSSQLETAPLHIQAHLGLNNEAGVLHHQSLHLADGKPYVASDRWVNAQAIPQILDVDFSTVSANEWLVANAPFTSGDIAFSATEADAAISERLGAKIGQALFTIDRTTWNEKIAITCVRLIFHPGYRMRTTL
jgi:GntR family histidine utilization transcriptional repressor